MRIHLPRSATALGAVTGLVASGLAAIAFAPAATADSAQPTLDCSAATTCSVTYGYSGVPDTFTVPARVKSVTIVATGASGGTFPRAGRGGVASGALAVTPGQTFTVAAGEAGSQNRTTPTFGGGGPVSGQSNAHAGGGGSFVYTSSGSLVLAAGGGGGAYGMFAGGNGGGTSGGDGIAYRPDDTYSGPPATGGSQSSGGNGGNTTVSGLNFGTGGSGSGPASGPATPGTGGGGSIWAVDGRYGGSGGGGGYYGGGGGGYVSGGGGGSGYLSSTLTAPASGVAVSNGSGSVTFTWSKITTITTLTANSAEPVEGDSVTLSAIIATDAANPTGTVAFRNGATAIPGCGNVSVDSSARAYCTTTFAAGTQTLNAVYSGDNSFAGSSGTLFYGVASKPTISTPSLASGTLDAAYSQQLSATGGTAPYTYSIVGDATLPAGLTLSAAGGISGTPTAVGTSQFTVRVTDSANPTRSTDKAMSIAVGKGSQQIEYTFAPTAPKVGDTYDIVVTKKGNSSKPVDITGNNNCSVIDNKVRFLSVGTCTVTARQPADDNYDEATEIAKDATVGQGAQQLMVTSNPPASDTVGQSHTLTVTGGGSTEKVSIGLSDSTTNSACSLGTVTTSFVAGTQRASAPISYDRVGTCSLVLQQGGDANYTSAATSFVKTEVDGKSTTVSVSLSSGTVVHGQPVTATATVTSGVAGTVYFSVDGRYYGAAEVKDGKATSHNLAAAAPTLNGRRQVLGGGGRGFGLAVGTHQVTATFDPADRDTYAVSTTATGTTVTVTPSQTTTTLKVNAKTLVATVAVKAPSEDKPTGVVEFLVDGKLVGKAELVDGVATLEHTAPTGKAVSAVYTGREDASENTEVNSSSASTARQNPTVTVRLSSSKAKSKAGWYSRPVTVRFSCQAGSGAVTCPKPVTVTRNGVTTVSRTITAADGGVATVSTTVKVDRTRPGVKVTGIKNGRVYPTLPKIGCRASDPTSGIASCILTRTVGGRTTTTFVATATDRAGNVSRSTVAVRRSPVVITGADYRASIPVVRLGKSYTLVYTGKGKPSYVYAAPGRVKPKGNGGPFTKIGKNRWAYSVVFTKNLRGHKQWSFGVKVGKKTLIVKVKIKK